MQGNSHKPFEEMLTPEEVATYLNISISTVYRYLNDKENPIPSYKFSSKNIRIKKKELDQWVTENLNTEKQGKINE